MSMKGEGRDVSLNGECLGGSMSCCGYSELAETRLPGWGAGLRMLGALVAC